MFGLEKGCVRIWGSGYVKIWKKNVKKVSMFGLRYIRVSVRGKWGQFIKVCEWWNDCE